jgi:hypothetical protein
MDVDPNIPLHEHDPLHEHRENEHLDLDPTHLEELEPCEYMPEQENPIGLKGMFKRTI